MLESKVKELENEKMEKSQNQLTDTRVIGAIRKNDSRYPTKS